MRTTFRSAAIALAAVAVAPVAVATASCTASGTPARHGSSPAPEGTVTTQPAPLWRTRIAGTRWDDPTVQRIDTTLVAHGGRDVIAFDERGHQLWRHAFAWSRWHPEQDDALDGDAEVDASTGTAIIRYDRAADPAGKTFEHVVEARNPLSGRQNWHLVVRPPGTISVTPTTVYVSTCRLDRALHVRGCELSARDPRDGRARWTIATEAPTTVPTETAPITTLQTSSILRTIVTSTGRPTGVRLDESRFGDSSAVRPERLPAYEGMAGSTLVLASTPRTSNPCDMEFEGLDARTGKRRWHRAVLGTIEVHDNASCQARQPPITGTHPTFPGRDGDGRPIVLDLHDGTLAWRGPRPARIMALDDRHVLAHTAGTRTLILYDLTTARAQWTLTDPAPELDWSFVGNRLVSSGRRSGCPGHDHCVDVYDLATKARVLTAPGELAGSDRGWIATTVPSTNGGGATLAVYSIA